MLNRIRLTGPRAFLVLAVLVAASAAGLSSTMFAQTADGETPAVEDVCSELEGAEYGQCNAYCEAMDCHLGDGIRASKNACDKALERYRTTFKSDPPCIAGNCATRCTTEAMDYYAACRAAGGTDKACISQAKQTWSKCFNQTCPGECYEGCIDGCATVDKACQIACRDTCYPRGTCTTKCETNHINALLTCASRNDLAQCAGDPACEEAVSYNRAACEAAADSSYDVCSTGCVPTPGGACGQDDIEMCGGEDFLCGDTGACVNACSSTWTADRGCTFSKCQRACVQPQP